MEKKIVSVIVGLQKSGVNVYLTKEGIEKFVEILSAPEPIFAKIGKQELKVG